MQMKWNEMHAASHLRVLQPLDEFVSPYPQAVEIELDDVEVPCMLYMSVNMGADDFW